MYYAELNIPKNHVYLFKPHYVLFGLSFSDFRKWLEYDMIAARRTGIR